MNEFSSISAESATDGMAVLSLSEIYFDNLTDSDLIQSVSETTTTN